MTDSISPSSGNQQRILINRTMRLLSQRDHSEAELRRKLVQQPSFTNAKFRSATSVSGTKEPVDVEIIDRVIAYCYQHNWLDDQRFANSFIAGRSRKGYGAQRIRSELMQKGVDKEIVQLALAACDIDWCAQARQIAERKFGDPLPVEWKRKARVQGYLLYRGFLQEEIQSIYCDFSQ